MKKRILLFVIVLLALYNNPTAHAQEIRLDSLWAKQGGVFAMSFSPDSKTLAIGEDGDEGQIRIFEAQTGREIDSIAHSFYVDLAFTPDGKKLLAIDQTGIKLFNGTTYKYERTISYDQGGLIAFSPDESKLALAGDSWIAIVDIQRGEVLAKLNRPDKYSTGPNKTEYYLNGKVTFSADGKYIIGKYENSLVRWDWQNEPNKPEVLITSIDNRSIIGFSPDKKYMVQQSNYLWDLQQRKQVAIEGMTSYYIEEERGFACTQSTNCIAVVDKDRIPKFVSMQNKKPINASEVRLASVLHISPDSSYFAYLWAYGQTRVYKMQWSPTSVVETKEEQTLQIHIQPQPVKSSIHIVITTDQQLLNCRISIVNGLGISVSELHNGSINMGEQLFNLSTASIPSGNYFVRVQSAKHDISQSFIITK